jgi:hypothetical protein
VADLLAADFRAVGTMRADETSAGAMVDVQYRIPSDAAGGQSRRRDEVPTMDDPSEGGERAASGSQMTNEIHKTRFQPCLA